MRVDEFAYRGIAFAHQRAVVEQLGGGQERFDGDGHDACAGIGECRDRGVERSMPLRVEYRQRSGYGDDGGGRCRQPGVGGPRPATGAGRHHVHRPVGEVEDCGENRDAVDGFARRDHTVGADHPDRGFDPDDALQSRRDAAGAGGVGADRDIGLAGGHRHCRTRTRAAADVFGPASTSSAGRLLIHTVMAINLRVVDPQCAIHPQPPRGGPAHAGDVGAHAVNGGVTDGAMHLKGAVEAK